MRRELPAALGVGTARSPSFALVHCYRGRIPVYHADLYRLSSPREVETLDLAETAADGVLLVEWAAHAAGEFAERLEIDLSFVPDRENARLISMRPVGPRYDALVRELKGPC